MIKSYGDYFGWGTIMTPAMHHEYAEYIRKNIAIGDGLTMCSHVANSCYRNSNRQSYTYEPDPDGEIIVAHWSKKVDFYHNFNVGRHEYYDYNFWGREFSN